MSKCKFSRRVDGRSVFYIEDFDKNGPVREVVLSAPDEPTETLLFCSYSPKLLEIELKKEFPKKDISITLKR